MSKKGETKTITIDEKDRKILEILIQNARTSYTEIAKQIGLSDVAVIKRIKKLEELGVIKRYTVIIDPVKLGYKLVALVGIDTEPEHIFRIISELKKIDSVRYVALTSGDHDIMAVIWARDREELGEIHNKIMSMNGVKRVCPSIILEKFHGGICL